MSAADVDLAILGGGLAGLTLAEALADSGLCVAVLEARRDYVTDRTWSFWSGPGEPEPWPGEQGRWAAWHVCRPDGAAVVRRAADWRYVSLDAGTWLATCAARIDAHPCQRLYRAAEVVDVVHDADTSRITLRAASPGAAVPDRLDARMVVDARLDWRSGTAAYGQHFLGYEVETEAETFDPTSAAIMEFRSGAMAGEGVDFVYLLPFDSRRALVEVTRFSARPPSRAALRQWLEAELRTRCGAQPVQVRRSETASLPMTVTTPARSVAPGRLLAIGQGAGVNRGATGYAFRRIRRQCRALADTLQRTGRLPAVAPDPGGAVERWMDRVFLRVIRRRPDRAPLLFERLFQRCPPARLVRFLDDRPSALDRACVIVACAHPAFAAGLIGPR